VVGGFAVFRRSVHRGRWQRARSPPWLPDGTSGLSTLVVPQVPDKDGCARAMAASNWNGGPYIPCATITKIYKKYIYII